MSSCYKSLIIFIVLLVLISCSTKQQNTQTSSNSSDSQLAIKQEELRKLAMTSSNDGFEFIDNGDSLINKAISDFQNNSIESKMKNIKVRESCIQARVYYSQAIQEFKNSNSVWEEFKKSPLSEKTQLFVQYYISKTNAVSNKAMAEIEACKELESASNYLDLNDVENAKLAVSRSNIKLEEAGAWSDTYNIYLDKLDYEGAGISKVISYKITSISYGNSNGPIPKCEDIPEEFGGCLKIKEK